MAINLICVCSKHMSLPDKYAGEHVQCPDCQAMLHVPSPEEDQRLTRWHCDCGMRLKARAQAAGRKVKCPQCAKMVAVPGRKTRPPKSSPPPSDTPSPDAATREYAPMVAPPETPITPLPPKKPSSQPPADIDISRQLPAASPPPPDHDTVLDDEDIDVSQQSPAAIPEPTPSGDARGTATFEAALEPSDAVEDIVLTPDDSNIEIPPGLTSPSELSLGEPQEYSVEAPPALSPPKPPPLAKPVTIPLAQAAFVPESVSALPPPPATNEAASDDEDADEGIRAALLTKYFNVQGGVEAAKAGVWQVVNGYWLYIPCALLYGCFYFLALVLARFSGEGPAAAFAALVFPVAGGVFVLGGLLGCVADGVFERSFGIERLAANGARHAANVFGTILLMSPIIAGIAVLWVFLTAWAASGGFGMLLLFLFLGMLGSVLMGSLVLTPLTVAVLERVNPFVAVGRGVLFLARNAFSIIALTIVSVLIGCGSVAVFRIAWSFAKPFLFSAPPWVYFGLHVFMSGLILSALAGQLAASIMLLYLSSLRDEDRLRDIQLRLRGPATWPLLLYATMLLAAVALFALSSQAGPPPDEADAPSARSAGQTDGDTDSEAPAPVDAKPKPADTGAAIAERVLKRHKR